MTLDAPFFSVIVPTRDRPDSLQRCLGALIRQEYPRERFEVVVVDDRSTTPVRPIVEAVEDRLRVRLVQGTGAGPARARNLGAREADGEMLAFTDDDCRPRPGWLGKLAEALLLDPGAGAGGRAVNVLEANPFSTTSQLLIDHLCDHYNEPPGAGSFFTTSNLALPARSFAALGGFSETFGSPGGEDRELVDRWVRSGRRILWAPDAVVDHDHPLTLGSFVDQHFRYGRGARVFHRHRRRAGHRRPSMESTRFYAEMLRRPFRERLERPLRIAALLVLSQAATVAGYVFAPGRKSPAGGARQAASGAPPGPVDRSGDAG